jgi:hypothetical protein
MNLNSRPGYGNQRKRREYAYIPWTVIEKATEWTATDKATEKARAATEQVAAAPSGPRTAGSRCGGVRRSRASLGVGGGARN